MKKNLAVASISISIFMTGALFQNCTGGLAKLSASFSSTSDSSDRSEAFAASPANALKGSSIFVDPALGNDANVGDIVKPLKTLRAALVLAKKGRANSVPTINLRAGTYSVLDTLVIGNELSGVAGSPFTIQAYNGEAAILDGRMQFKPGVDGSWTYMNITSWDGTARGVYKFQLNEKAQARLVPYIQKSRALVENAGKFFVSDIYLGDTVQVRSRHPNAAVVADWSFMHLCASNPPPAGTSGCLPVCYAGPGLPLGCNPAIPMPAATNGLSPVVGIPLDQLPHPNLVMDGKTEVVMTKNFQNPRGIILNVPVANMPDASGKTFSFLTMNMSGTWASGVLSTDWSPSAPDKVHLENNLSFIDSPGEWYFDDDQLALFLQPTSASDLTKPIGIPIPRKFLSFEGGTLAKPNAFVKIIGLTFQYSRWAYGNLDGNSLYYSTAQGGHVLSGAVDGVYVDNIQILNNSFSYVGEASVRFGGYRRGLAPSDLVGQGKASNLSISQNRFVWGGGPAIGVDNYGNKITNNHIDHNYVSDIGRVFTDSVAIAAWHTSNTIINNNEIHRVPYIGIHAGRLGHYDINDYNLVKENYIQNAMTIHDDGGGIYIEGSSGQILNNTVTGLGQLRSGDALTIGFAFDKSAGGLYFGHDIYLDSFHSYWYIDGNHVEHSMNINSRTDVVGGSNSGGALLINHPVEDNWPNSIDAACETRAYGDLQFSPYTGASTAAQKPAWFTVGGPDSLNCAI